MRGMAEMTLIKLGEAVDKPQASHLTLTLTLTLALTLTLTIP